MEKRLFLAVFLSLIVVFGFQTFFGPKTLPPSAANIPVSATTPSPAPITLKVDNSGLKKAVEPVVFEEKTTLLEYSTLKVSLSNKGGDIVAIDLKKYKYTMPTMRIASVDLVENNEFTIIKESDVKANLSYKSSEWLVNKEVTINNNYTINVDVTVKNVSNTPRSFAGNSTGFDIDISSLDKQNVQSDHSLYEYSIKSKKNIFRKDNVRNFNEKWNKQENSNVEWVAFRDKFFVTIVQPKDELTNYFVKPEGDAKLTIGSTLAGVIVEPQASVSFNYKAYAGPQRLDVLGAADKSFEKVMVFSNWGWLDAISKGIYWLLGVIHNMFPSWGLCIVLISVFVYGLMYPLTAKSLVSMRKLQVLQPKMKELQEKYKGNPEKLNKEVVELYRIHQVNPLSGCLPMLLQMPIFVGLYQVLWRTVYFRGESFLWMKDLSLPDHTVKLPFTLPFLGEYLNILPILMVIIMAVQQQMNIKMTPTGNADQASQQKMMAVIFPVLIGFIFYNMASGLNLYFVVFYVLSTLSQWHLSRDVKAE